MEWIEAGKDVHALYQSLLSIGALLMRVEDHLTMQIPGAEAELEKTKAKLLEMAEKIQTLIDLVQPAGVNHD